MNRAERRAHAQGKVKYTYLRVAFTPDEASLIEEAMDAYRLQLLADTEEGERTDVQKWALERSASIGAAMRAAIENRLHHDTGDREAPA